MTDYQPHILIVDDETDACQNLSDILCDLGYRVDVALDGGHALELVGRRTYDVALLDLKMPGMDGVELFKRIREFRSETVVIVVTAFAGGKIAEAARDAGADQIVAKPVNLKRLLSLVEGVLLRPRVLIVDDDREFCSSLSDVLRGEGYRVGTAADAPGAEAQLRAGGYNAVFIDMKLPVGSGADVFHLMRDHGAQTSTILISAHRDEVKSQIEELLCQGAASAAYKPLDMPHLLDTLKRLTSPGETAI